jgi:membrane-bound lytic murein transglycosylase D
MLRKNLTRKTFFSFFILPVFAAVVINPAAGYSSPGKPLHGKILQLMLLQEKTKTFPTESMAVKSTVAKISLNKNVAGFVTAYLKKEEEFLQKMKNKSRTYFRTIEKVFDQHEIPQQLKYLAIVESELHSNAKSRVGARGLWQLMPVTAKELGLRISGKTDERIHTYRSTVAAAKYLRYLYGEFGDWLLVLAAYNGGPGTVYKAMKKAGSKNFWAIQRFLPAESRGHVKRFISIHYFFEGDGSITTQTKTEAKVWAEKNDADKDVYCNTIVLH